MNVVFIANAAISKKNREVSMSTNVGQKVIEQLRADALSNMDNYLKTETYAPEIHKLSEAPFNIKNLGKGYADKYYGEIIIKGGTAKLTKDSKSGEDMEINVAPSNLGMVPNRPVTITNLATKE